MVHVSTHLLGEMFMNVVFFEVHTLFAYSIGELVAELS